MAISKKDKEIIDLLMTDAETDDECKRLHTARLYTSCYTD